MIVLAVLEGRQVGYIGIMKTAAQREAVTEALNRIYEQEPSGLDPVVMAIQAASLEEEDWSSGRPGTLDDPLHAP